MTIKHCFFLLILINFFKGTSQNSDFKSQVIDEKTYKPVDGAIISVDDLNVKVKSNNEGVFKFTTDYTFGTFLGKVEHDDFITKLFLVEFIDGKLIEVETIKLKATYKEGFKRRRRTQKENIEKARLKKRKLKEIRRRERLLAKQNKGKNISIDIAEPNIETTQPIPDVLEVEENVFSDVQYKYAKLLNTPIENLSNNNLYVFIDKWINQPFNKQQSETTFLQDAYKQAYGLSIESSSVKLYNSEFTNKFSGKQHLREGDLLFFNKGGSSQSEITHVGIYLHNNKFVHDSKNINENPGPGVVISDLTEDYWQLQYVSAGRRINNQ